MKLLRLALTVVFLGIYGSSFSQTRAELERRKAQLNKDIEMINNTLKQTSTSKKVTLKELNALKAQIRLREEKIRTINSEVRLLDGEINQNMNNIRSLQAQLKQLKTDYAAMIRFAQKNQGAYSKLMYVFAAEDFNQAYKRLKYLQQFSEYRVKQAKYIEETQAALKNKVATLNKNKSEKSHLLSDQQKEKNVLGQAENKQSKVIKSLTSQERKLRQDLSQKQRAAAQLDRAIRAAIQREIALAKKKAEEEARAAAAKARAEGKEAPAATTSTSRSSVLAATPEAAKLSAGFVSNRGRLPWPVANGVITESYGTQKIGNITKENNGWTIRANTNAPVRAVFEGTVSRIVEIAGKNVVMIRHGEFFTIYQNLKSISVSSGQKVGTKQTIGTVASDEDGISEIHFELWKGMETQNPGSWLAN
ncbi:peptidoglycan DD-metalloendopeptidase family protein [Pseudopedobacter sp.]|uniref:murein hydrolase activator EnvC family protein n=1 Tax=Pseudopedobacter sp. TaxID=1936787 RepID=UPI00333F11A3